MGLALATLPGSAGTRASDHFTMSCEVLASGQPQAASEHYTVDCALDSSGGPVAASGSYTLKPGYVGQLYDVVALEVSADPATVDETGTRQLEAAGVCDDTTRVAIDALEVAWSVVTGPITSISSAGLATAGIVFEDSGAVVEGIHLGFSDEFSLTVLEVVGDNYLSYAGDGIDDDWQILHFGEESPDAGPGENPDGDRYDNLGEFLTGFDPTDPRQTFEVWIHTRADNTVELELNKAIPDRIYKILAGTDLHEYPETVATFTVSSEENGVGVADPEVSESTVSKFYRVVVERSGE
jgi:hypothetical protein